MQIVLVQRTSFFSPLTRTCASRQQAWGAVRRMGQFPSLAICDRAQRCRAASMPTITPAVDEVSVALVLGIAVCLGLGTYLRQSLQPALHPLILSRQADASQVRSVDESATYRNVNAPIGFDLAMRPQRGAPDVPALVHEAIGGEQARRLLDATLSNADLLQAAAELARGVGALLAGDKAPEADDPILLLSLIHI